MKIISIPDEVNQLIKNYRGGRKYIKVSIELLHNLVRNCIYLDNFTIEKIQHMINVDEKDKNIKVNIFNLIELNNEYFNTREEIRKIKQRARFSCFKIRRK